MENLLASSPFTSYLHNYINSLSFFFDSAKNKSTLSTFMFVEFNPSLNYLPKPPVYNESQSICLGNQSY